MDLYSFEELLIRAIYDNSGTCLYNNYDAAVAIIYEAPSGFLILIERIERMGDPWSGHIAFPGGFRKAGENSYKTAVREAMEEISVDLWKEIHLGSMGLWTTRNSVRVIPHVFIARSFLKASPGGEVRRALRVRPQDLVEVRCPDGINRPPCFYSPVCGDKVIWGLTARILARLMRHERSER